MTIGSIGGSGFGFGQQSFRVSIKNDDDTENLKKQFSVNKNQKSVGTAPSVGSSQQGFPPGGPDAVGVGGQFPGGKPPTELSKDDLNRIKDGISKSGGQGADKIDELINNFDKYDTEGTGKISVDQFKQYATQNGIELPKPPQGGNSRGDFHQQLPQGSSPQGSETQAVAKNAVAGLLSKYAASAATASSSTAGSTTSSTSTESTSSSPSTQSNSSTSSSTKKTSEMSTAELEKAAAKGDVDAQNELKKRKAEAAEKSSKDSSDSTNQKVSATVSVEA